MLTEEKSEKRLEAEANEPLGKVQSKTAAEICEGLNYAEDPFEYWVRLVDAQKIVGEKDEEIGKDEKLIEALEDYGLRLWGCLNQARKLAEEFTVKRALEQNSPLCDFLERLERILGGSGSGGSAEATVTTGAKSSEVNPTLVVVSLREDQKSRGSREAVGTPSGKPAPQPKTQAEDCCFRKVKVLRGRAKEAADKQGLGPEDLVVLTTKIKNGEPPEYMVEGDAVSFLLKRAVVGGEIKP